MNVITYSFGNGWGAGEAPVRETMASIAARVAVAHGYTLKDLHGPRRHRLLAYARFEAMWLMRQLRTLDGAYRYSLTQIGNFFDRDHTTVLHALNRYESGQTRRLAA